MCFITDANAKPKIAKKDMVVWKRGFRPRNLKPQTDFFESGVRSYIYLLNNPEPKVELIKEWHSTTRCEINAGYHSCYDKYCNEYPGRLGKFLIPKGATYYTDSSYRERVSDTIIFLGWVDEGNQKDGVIYA